MADFPVDFRVAPVHLNMMENAEEIMNSSMTHQFK